MQTGTIVRNNGGAATEFQFGGETLERFSSSRGVFRSVQGGLFLRKTPPKRNTVHLTILMAFRMLIGGRGMLCRGRSGKLVILRLTPRKLRRLRLETTRSSSISPSTAL
jgi:hypothetical protein